MNLSANSPTGFTRVRFGGHSDQRFRRSLTDFAEANVSFFDAAILIFSPLPGLRPSRSGVVLTLNFPKPGSDTSAPLAAASTMSFKMPSTIDLACALLTPCVSGGIVTLPRGERKASAAQELSGGCQRGPPRVHRRGAKHA